jgi:mono/diheme cytochrome c family protein
VLTAISTLNTNVIALDSRTRTMHQRLQKLEGGSAPAALPPAAAPVSGHAAVLSEHCGACHTAGKLYSAGDRTASLAILAADGTVAMDLTPASLKQMKQKVEEGAMPPKDVPGAKPLDAASRAELLKWIDSIIGPPASGSRELPRRSYALDIKPISWRIEDATPSRKRAAASVAGR